MTVSRAAPRAEAVQAMVENGGGRDGADQLSRMQRVDERSRGRLPQVRRADSPRGDDDGRLRIPILDRVPRAPALARGGRIDPQTGRKRVAKGIIAIGDLAIGGVAIGGLSCGVFAIGGLSTGVFALGGLAVALGVAMGGLTIGTIAIGGLAVGYYALGGTAFGAHVISSTRQDPEAVKLFGDWATRMRR